MDLRDPKVNAQILWQVDLCDSSILPERVLLSECFVLFQLSALLVEDGWTDFNLQWTVEPQKSPE